MAGLCLMAVQEKLLVSLEEQYAKNITELGIEQDLINIEGLTSAMIVSLGEAGIKTRDDLADLASDELCSKEDGLLREYQLSEDDANRIIMEARAHWFDDEEKLEKETLSQLFRKQKAKSHLPLRL